MAQALRKNTSTSGPKKAAAKNGAKKTGRAAAAKQATHSPPEWMPRGHEESPRWNVYRVRRGILTGTNFNAFERDKHERLAADLTISENLVKGGRSMTGSRVEKRVGGSIELLRDAQNSMADGRPEQAWREIKAVRRVEITNYTEEQRRVKALELMAESEKISVKWRREAVRALLTVVKGSGRRVPSVDAVIKAAELRDEHFDKVWARWRLRRRNLFYLFGFLPLVLAAVLYLSDLALLGPGFNNAPLLLAIFIFGGLGATLSTVYSVTRLDASARFNERINTSITVLMRPLIGAATAIAAYIVLLAAVNADAASIQNIAREQIYLFAFIAGLVDRFIYRLSPKTDE
ncbi:MAG: hypothetical protein IID51_13025 [Proteobacteria bacterium]|nr:hypothetical protein [Pseudomonadota bacterium]